MQNCNQDNLELTIADSANPLTWESNIRMIKSWIHDCRDNHFACSPLASISVPARPTRLVYVGGRDADDHPRLVLSRDLPEDTRYAALSYPWGPPSSMRMTTTLQNMNAHFRGLAQDKIPLTFRDTFRTVRMLGLDYVWIDALCICQNHERDWEVEAAKMGDIYRGAQITLVAASACSTNDGFLRERKSKTSVRIPFQSTSHDSVCGEYLVTFSERGYKEDFGRDVEESFWNERGCQHPVSGEPALWAVWSSTGGDEHSDWWSRTSRVKRKPEVNK